ncbi:Uncharacterised protein [Candidatus Gugararchaeum adminiculabundum]|nr:Uncharacterised protein [Candidatus Gugararchaeum adminiculabundum]
MKKELYSVFSWLVDSKALYIALAISFLLALFLKSSLFGILTAIFLLLGLIAEIYVGLQRGGVKNELKETAIALLIAVVIWFGASFILSVPSPLNAVVSCSMLPELQVGDMILLQGGEPSAPVAQISDSAIAKINDRLAVTVSAPGIGTLGVPNGIYPYCTNIANYNKPICILFTTHPEQIIEHRGPLDFKFEACERINFNNTRYLIPCTRTVSINAMEFKTNFSTSVIVYNAPRDQLFGAQGDIIHRVIVKLKTENGSTYYLTKGDNNPIFDLQAFSSSYELGNNLAPSMAYKGKMIARHPYLGYFKMFLFGRFSGGEGCDSTFTTN